MIPLINEKYYFLLVTNYKIQIKFKEIEMSTKMTIATDCVLHLLEERLAGSELQQHLLIIHRLKLNL
jgi:hypothetical protein